MRKFRFFMALAMLAGMFACQNELEQEVKIPEVEKSDVYAENGYLVFKDYNAADSVLKIVSKYSKMEYDAWQNELGFKSALSYARKYYDEYNAVETLEGWYVFKGKYETTLNIVETEDEVSIDFPFENEPWNPIINTEGVVKVGESLILFEKDATKSILDGDVTKLDAAKKLEVSDPSKKIQVYNKKDGMKSTAIYDNSYWGTITNWGDFENSSKKRGVSTRLDYQQIAYYIKDINNPNTHVWQMVTEYYICQTGLKYRWWKWREYETILHIKDIEMYSTRKGYAYSNGFFSSEETTTAYFKFHFTVDERIVYGEVYPDPTTADFDTNLKIAFKQNTRGIGEWISDYKVDYDDDDSDERQDYCYPFDWTYWKTHDFSSFGELINDLDY